MGFPLEETNGVFCDVFKSRLKRKVIKNVKEYEQGNWIHVQAASLFCLEPRPVHSFRLAEREMQKVCSTSHLRGKIIKFPHFTIVLSCVILSFGMK